MKVSVIIPVCDVAPYLRACLDSLLAQSFADWEAICVDDGATDESGAILDEYGRRDARFRVVHRANAGVGAARNCGLDLAKGAWVAFVDGDDQVSGDWLGNAMALAASHPKADVIHIEPAVSVADPFSPAEPPHYCKTLERAKAEARKPVVQIREFADAKAREWALGVYSRRGWPVMNFVRRETLGRIRFPVGVRLKEDVVFFIELAVHLRHVVSATYPGYFYIRRTGSAVMRKRTDADSIRFAEELEKLGGRLASEDVWRAISVALEYDFVQWADERDPNLPYDPERCALRRVWRNLAAAGHLHGDEMYWWWRLAIRRWQKTGSLKWAHVIRRIREALPC